MKPTAEEIWYSRNPVHEINIDTGKDMFDDTMKLCMQEYAVVYADAVSKDMYPKAFVEWMLMSFARSDINAITFEVKWVIQTETHILDFLTTKEAFKYWFKNVKK